MAAAIAESRWLGHARPLPEARHGNAKRMADSDNGEPLATVGTAKVRSELVGLGSRDRNDPRSLYDGEELAMTPTRTPRAGLGAGIGTVNRNDGGHGHLHCLSGGGDAAMALRNPPRDQLVGTDRTVRKQSQSGVAVRRTRQGERHAADRGGRESEPRASRVHGVMRWRGAMDRPGARTGRRCDAAPTRARQVPRTVPR